MTKSKRILFVFLGSIIGLALSSFLLQVFSGDIILSPSFNVGPVSIRYYGLILGLAVLASYWVAVVRRPDWLSTKQIDSLIIYVVIFGFLGARAYHVLTQYDLYTNNFWGIFQIWNGGLGIYGAVAGGVLAVIVWLRIYKFNLRKILPLLDLFAPSVALGQTIGRFGNFFNYELFGYPTNNIWKMFVPLSARPEGYTQFSYFQPLFLYESLISFLIFYLLYIFLLPRKSYNGQVFFTYVFLYTIARFGLEFLRIESVFWSGIRINAYISLGLALLSLACIFYARKRHISKT